LPCQFEYMKIMVLLTEANPDTKYSEDYACA
jgi:hypothetical protein